MFSAPKNNASPTNHLKRMVNESPLSYPTDFWKWVYMRHIKIADVKKPNCEHVGKLRQKYCLVEGRRLGKRQSKRTDSYLQMHWHLCKWNRSMVSSGNATAQMKIIIGERTNKNYISKFIEERELKYWTLWLIDLK